MAEENARAIFVSDEERAVELISNFLQEKGIEVEIVHHMPESDGMGLTPFASSGSSNHLEVLVKDVEKLQDARQLLTRYSGEILEQAQVVDLQPAQVVVECDDCEETNVYPGELQGTVQECEHCGSYLDVPGGDDQYDWSIVDETVAEDDMEQEEDPDADAWG